MATVKTLHTSFVGGEIAPEMFGRFDIDMYQQGLGLCRNFIVKPQGAVENRPGFEFVRSVKYPDKATRLIPFFFDVTQTMVLELGDRYVRFHTLGATVLDSAGSVYEVVTPYSAADVFDIHYVQSADVLTLVHPRYAPRELRRYGATDWRLVKVNFDPTIAPPVGVTVDAHVIDGSKNYDYQYAVTAVSDSDYAESLPSVTVSVANNLLNTGSYNNVKWQQVAGAAHYHVYRKYGGVFCFLGLAKGLDFMDENITPDASKTVPMYDKAFNTGGISSVTLTSGGSGYNFGGAVTGGTVYAPFIGAVGRFDDRQVLVGDIFLNGSGLTVDGRLILLSRSKRYKFSYVGEGAGSGARIELGIKGNMVSLERVLFGGGGYAANTKIKLFVEVQFNGSNIWQEVSTNFYVAVKTSAGVPVSVSDATGYGAVLEAVENEGEITAVKVVSPGYGYTNPTVSILGGGSGAVVGEVRLNGSDFPGAVSYFQQRRIFAGSESKPQTVWMTKSGTESNMSYSIPVRANDRVNVTVAAREASRILHIVPLTSLVLMTSSSEWRMSGGSSDVITPDSVQVAPQSFIGANNVQPLIINNSMVYAASRGGHVRELGYNWQAGGFVTGDISIKAPHLFDDADIVDLTQAKSPVPVIWAVSSSGKLLGCTYLPEQNVGAWHQHDTYKGSFLSCTAVSEGTVDALYVVVERVINGNTVRNIERLGKRSFTDTKECFFVDSGLTYRGKPTKKISGLFHLEGEVVNILADGAVVAPQKVLLGQINLEHEASVVHIGLPIEADLKTLPIAAQIDKAFGQGRQKNINKVYLRVVQSGGIFVGQDGHHLTEVKQRTVEPPGSAPNLKSGEIRLNITPSWGGGGEVFVRQYDPLPLTVVSMTAEVSLGG